MVRRMICRSKKNGLCYDDRKQHHCGLDEGHEEKHCCIDCGEPF